MIKVRLPFSCLLNNHNTIAGAMLTQRWRISRPPLQVDSSTASVKLSLAERPITLGRAGQNSLLSLPAAVRFSSRANRVLQAVA